jgi:magnesium transporter
MSLASRLAGELLRLHPERAARALERVERTQAACLLEAAEPEIAGPVLEHMTPHDGAATLAAIESGAAARVVGVMSLDVASRLARRLDDEPRARLLAGVPARLRASLDSLLRFPEHTAGALLDPEVLALPADVNAAEALERIRAEPEHARYNVYVVDRDQRLVGVVNLRELLLARPPDLLADLMVRQPLHLAALASRADVLAHPGWKEVHALPVVDEQGAYLGAIRYRTLRRLEEELLERPGEDGDATAALGQLFATAATGLLEALTGPVTTKTGGR